MMKIRVWCKALFAVTLLMCCGLFGMMNAHAGNWFGNSSESGSAASGSGSQNTGGECRSDKTNLGPCGYSWIFYKSTGNWSGDLYFRPLYDGMGSPYISSVCAENSVNGGGFWHLGRNVIASQLGKSSNYNFYTGYFIGKSWAAYYYEAGIPKICPWDTNQQYCPTREYGKSWTQEYYNNNFAYWSTYDDFGHAASYTYDILRSYGIGYYGGTRNYNSKPGRRNGQAVYHPLGQSLYAYNGNGWVEAYRATKVSDSDDIGSEVWNDYVEAYKAANNGKAPTSWPSNMYAFCYYDGIYTKPVTLTIISVDVNGMALKTKPDTATVNSGERAEKTIESIEDYNKIKWCNDSGLTQCVNDTGLTYVVNSLTENKTVYAVYEEQGSLVDEEVSIDISVRNDSVSKYSSYQKDIYAKPDDNLQYRLRYSPLSQSAFEALVAAGGAWKDYYNIVGNPWQVDHLCSVGGTCGQITDFYNYKIASSDVGKNLQDTAGINTNSLYKSPTKITYRIKDGEVGVVREVTNALITDTVSVKVPYNFETSVTVDVSGASTGFVSGQEAIVKYDISVIAKCNPLTTNASQEACEAGSDSEAYQQGAYKTNINDAKIAVITYLGEESGGVGSYTGNELCGAFGGSNCVATLDKNGVEIDKNNGYTNPSFKITVPDTAVAGDSFCVAVAVYPANSGAYSNLDAKGSNSWRISASKCYKIAKTPTFQVWGGSLYTNGTINTFDTTKQSIGGVELGGSVVYSSWVEQSVVANGTVKSLASGAATGYNRISDSLYGGSLETGIPSYCLYRVPLSITNTGCNGSMIMDSAGATASFDVDKFIKMAELAGYEIRKGGDIVIEYNISASDKVVYYATGDIKINCNVSNINAVLIAKKDIDTCADVSDVNASGRANQLVVTGAVYAGGVLRFNRTYGAASGINSYIPAEIINYDASLIMSIGNYVDALHGEKIRNVYQHELGPRY